jgi:DNA-binding PadR family transcriptional regulator
MKALQLRQIDLFILSLILENPRHGYELLSISEERGASWSATQVYHSLKKLSELGIINKKLERQYDRPDKTVYTMTKNLHKDVVALIQHSLATSQRKTVSLLQTYSDLREQQNILQLLRLKLAHAFGSPLRKS